MADGPGPSPRRQRPRRVPAALPDAAAPSRGLPGRLLREGISVADRATREALVFDAQQRWGNGAVQRALAGVVQRQTDGLLVDDGATDLSAGQMPRAEFLAALRAAVDATLDEAGVVVAGAARQQVDDLFRQYATQGAAVVERDLRNALPAASLRDARGYIPLVCAGLRERMAQQSSAAGLAGAAGEVAAGLAAGVASLGSSVAGLFARRSDGGSGGGAVLRPALGAGQPLDGRVRAGLEAASGGDLSHVRVHTGPAAAELAAHAEARAVTVGTDVAFAAGEYQPGTPVGDGLIAHEVAHVTQQHGAETPATDPTAPAHEEEADRTAVHGVLSLWGWVKDTTAELRENAMPRLRSGLRLSRCAAPAAQQGPRVPSASQMTPDQWRQAVTTARAIGDAGQRAVAMTGLAQAAVSDAGIAVVQAGQSDGRMTNPVDYQEAPTLNFDEALNGKNRWSGAHRGSAVPVGTNAGYNFHDGAHGYAVIGPNALNPASPAVTRQYAQHELSLVSTPQQAGVSANQRELVQWTADFRAYFHAYLTIPLPQRPAWHPLLQYYEADDVSDAARRTAVQQLVDYHAHPPADAAEAEDIRRQIRHWISRNGTRALAVALRAALPSP